ncbi:hypothetical protein DYB34_010743 [Aphanomyces astaci]|uniref:DDE-1 domain-containing protein n=1 Tax=Aphanomyces astaci TaxID=112090 RepID=A0A3R6ZCW8_APHAT|nr:hypothetical protein DYB34_010743 [Aphanomyces astaci]
MYALLGPCSSLRLFAKSYHIPEATFRRWVTNSSSYLSKKTHGPRATLHGKGRLESVEFSSDLVAFMESVRDGEHFLTTAHLVTWMKSHRPLWLKAYMDAKLNDDRAYKSLLQWCPKFANRKKMPMLIIGKGTPGGDIERHELPTYPVGPVYAVQKTAYMNQRVWSYYLREVLMPDIDCPSVVLADNLKCHVSKKSYKILEDELFSVAYLQPLPASTTSVLQPLDVGVLGPFKQMCRSEWIKEEKVVTTAEKRLAMIKRSIKVWDAMKEDTIRKSFEKALTIFEI